MNYPSTLEPRREERESRSIIGKLLDYREERAKEEVETSEVYDFNRKDEEDPTAFWKKESE